MSRTLTPGQVLSLRHHEEPEGGYLADTTPPPARPPVYAEGLEFEVVWTPHRNAASLLGPLSRPSTLQLPAATVLLQPEDPNRKDRWSWQG